MSEERKPKASTPREPEAVPEGFETLPEGIGFLDALAPLYRKMPLQEAVIGLVVMPHHVNMMGICHGGVLMTLADAVAATGINLARGEVAGSPTINLSLDFISAAKQGEWVQGVAQSVNVKKRFGFCSGVIETRRTTIATFKGTFYIPDHDGLWQSDSRRGLLNPD